MQSQLASKPVIPRPALIGAGALMLFAVVTAAISARFGAHGTPDLSSPVAARDLSFQDAPGGAVRVVSEGAVIATLPPKTNGFLRSTMRGLVRARHAAGLGAEAPFHLTAWSDGRLTLDDPATGRRLDLEAFGPTNEAAFSRLLPLERHTP